MSEGVLRELLRELRARAAMQERPESGVLLRRAREIPVRWPDAASDAPVAERMRAALERWGGTLDALPDEAAVLPRVGEILRAAGARSVARWRTPRLERLDWERGLAPLELTWIEPTPEGDGEPARRAAIERLAGADATIIDCDLAVAHTGSLVVRHSAERPGLAGLLPWTLIALVWRAQVVATLEEAFAWLGRERAPAHTLFTTGPSRSADIDLRVGQGAAGPGRHHVLLIEGGTVFSS